MAALCVIPNCGRFSTCMPSITAPHRIALRPLYSIIAHIQWNEGTFYLTGGLRTLANALDSAARRNGIEVRLNCAASEIVTDAEGTVVAVKTAQGEPLAADAVVCNADPLTTYSKLLPDSRCPKAFRSKHIDHVEPSTSAFLLLLGVRGTYDHLAHYNSFLPDSPSAEFDAIFRHGVPADDPVIGVTCQSVDR